MALLFVITLFVSAGLLFWVQPLIAKALLPSLGGTPAVWNTCMLFFQSMLLCGYLYVLAATRWLGVGRQAILHLVLLLVAALSLPFMVFDSAAIPAPVDDSPVVWLLGRLTWTLGLPFFVLSASAPLLQKWFSRTTHPAAGDPYFLYAASNAGSLCALVAFPLLLEPNLRLPRQGALWAGAYGLLVVLVAACAFVLWRSKPTSAGTPLPRPPRPPRTNSVTDDEARRSVTDGKAPSVVNGVTDGITDNIIHEITHGRRALWVMLAFVPSSLVLGVTTYISTDIAAVPLLWVIPLALYLLTFVLAFAKRGVPGRGVMGRVLQGAALLVTLAYLSGATEPGWLVALVHLVFFFIAALVCHGRLADARPPAAHLDEFYLWVAVGGALGGVFNALVAPVVFDDVIEYPLLIVLACLMLARRGENSVGEERSGWGTHWRDAVFPIGIGLLTAALALASTRFEIGMVGRVAIALGIPLMVLNHFFARRPVRFAFGLGAIMLGSIAYTQGGTRTLHVERNFYGTLRVTRSASETFHRLQHGSTIHGRQFIDPSRRCEPLSYYHRTGPLGSVFAAFDAQPAAPNVAVIGLGTGATAAYAQTGERWTFYEINPAMIEVARDPKFFNYLSECAAVPIEIVAGDARLQIRNAPPRHYGLIVLDAFSSDAIPAHLLTREALALYLDKLADRGLLAFHVSNRSLNLHHVAEGLAKNAGLTALVIDDREYDSINGKEPSQWVVLARCPEDLVALTEGDTRWLPLMGHPDSPLWSDDFSDIIGVFKWLG